MAPPLWVASEREENMDSGPPPLSCQPGEGFVGTFREAKDDH